ncbi:MAG: type II toxin-antitoxin system RelE/ParE family toxin [Treponema sp.]
MWKVDSSNEYDSWFESLHNDEKEAILERVILLSEFGPNLPRPYADVLHGSKKCKNHKELRNQTTESVLRVSYYFDPKRNAFLITGGDKKGKNEKKFYKDLVSESEKIIARHEKEI